MQSNPQGGFRFHHWFSFSLILHAALIAPCILVMRHSQRSSEKHKNSKLQVELFGMISNRQAEARIQRHGAPLVQAQQASRPPQPQAADKALAPDNVVRVKGPEEKPKQNEPTPNLTPSMRTSVVSASGPLGASTYGNSDTYQTQQRIGGFEGSMDPIRMYSAKLAKSIRRNLAYPSEARRRKVEGSPTVTFVVMASGSLKENSLMIKKSSGHPILDSSALQTVRASSPFEKPPKEVRITVTLVFNVEMVRDQMNRAAR